MHVFKNFCLFVGYIVVGVAVVALLGWLLVNLLAFALFLTWDVLKGVGGCIALHPFNFTIAVIAFFVFAFIIEYWHKKK